jgi:predicted methyltransferase
MVVTFRNVHNWVMADAAPGMFKACFDVLKPGGVLGVTDHRAAPGSDLEKIKKSGYLPEDFVIKLATDAGFKLDAKSEVNANPKDTKDYAEGVWTLPPTLTLGVKDKDKYLAIGESDRMTLKFVKPAGADQIQKDSNEAKSDSK